MGIHQVSRNRIMKMQNVTQTLTPGQILQGKVLKLFPDNKAQLKLGSQVLFAQLAASLSVGETYHFQVQTVDEVIYLKVLGGKVETHSPLGNQVAELIRQLALNPKRTHIDFLQALVKEDIGFNRNQLVKALQLLDNSTNKPIAQQVIKELFLRSLPITQPIYEALKATKTNTFTENLSHLLKQLNQINNPNALERATSERISALLGKSTLPLIHHFFRHSLYRDKDIFNLLRGNGAINQNITFSNWNSKWEAYTNSNNRQSGSQQKPFPFTFDMEKLELGLQHLQSTTNIVKQSQLILSNWTNEINKAKMRQVPMSKENFALFKREITEQLVPLLSNHQQIQIISTMMQNNSESLIKLITILNILATVSSTKKEQGFVEGRYQNINSTVPIQHQFLNQMNQLLQFSGLTYENLLAKGQTVPDLNTLKPLLIQLINNNSVVQERAQQLLHSVTGLQLKSINETSNFIQASIQIPGEKFELNEDMLIEFESKKSADGKINPDYCRILFYLDLANLRETVIDMHIQKRLISITIFNDHKNIRDHSTRYEPLLKKGVEKLDYRLSNVTVQPLTKKAKQGNRVVNEFGSTSYEGFDYRI